MIIGPASTTITSAGSDGYCIVGSVRDMQVGINIWINFGSEDPLNCIVTEINRTTKEIGVREVSQGGFGRTDVSAYAGGTIDISQQLWADTDGPTLGDGEFEGDITVEGDATFYGMVFPGQYPTASLPTASSNEGGIAYDTTTNTFKYSNGTSWATPGSITIGDTVASATAGSILFAGVAGVLAQDNAKLFWDNTNDFLGIGTAAPASPLDILGITVTTQATDYVSGAKIGGTYTKNDSNTRVFHGLKIHPTLNTGGSNANTTVNVLSIDTTNTAVTGLTTNLIKASYGGTAKFTVNSDGKITLANAQVDVGTGNFYSTGTDAFVGGIIRPATTGVAMKIRGADNATADIAYFGSAIALTTGVIARFYNDNFTTEKARINSDGSYYTTTGSITATSITANSSLIQSGGNQAMEVKGWAADGVAAIGCKLIAATELTTAGAMIANFYNAATIKGSVTKDGQFRTIGTGRYLEISASQAVTVAHDYVVVKGNGAPVTVTLPLASTVAAGYGFTVKDGAGTAVTHNLTIARAGSDTIDGATSQVMTTNWSSVTIVSDGVSAWYLV